MEGFERFDVRAWGENGVTKHVARQVARAAQGVVRVGRTAVAQVTIAVVASVGAATLCAMPANAGINTESSTAVNVTWAKGATQQSSMLQWIGYEPPSPKLQSTARLFADAALQENVLPAYAPRKALGHQVGTKAEFGTALERFAAKRPAEMSEHTRLIADRILEKRKERAAEDGKTWAERVMNNIYG